MELSIRVQLFSRPQQQEAPSTRREPELNSKLSFPSKLRRMLAKVTREMAIQSRLERTSRNTRNANREVATISKLFSKDTLAEFVRSRPSISRMGAAISRTTMPIVQGSSLRVSGSAVSRFPESSRQRYKPSPAPRYRNAAIMVGDTCVSRSFDRGRLTAYNAAAKRA